VNHKEKLSPEIDNDTYITNPRKKSLGSISHDKKKSILQNNSNFNPKFEFKKTNGKRANMENTRSLKD